MSGHALHDKTLIDNKNLKYLDVPIIIANKDNFKNYGNFVYDYQNENVEIVPWPLNGKRKLSHGTGTGGGIIEGEFKYVYKNDNDGLLKLFAQNLAIQNSDSYSNEYITGLVVDNSEILIREANYHPDGGQVFFPMEKKPFIALLALPTDDILPEHFVGFLFDGSCGCQIKPNIWHQPIYPLLNEKSMTLIGKQGAVHGCVCVDFIEEFNTVLRLKI